MSLPIGFRDLFFMWLGVASYCVIALIMAKYSPSSWNWTVITWHDAAYYSLICAVMLAIRYFKHRG